MGQVAVRHLRKDYRTRGGTIRALGGVSFALPEGALCTIVGPSGSGKTTLLALLGGLDTPTSGEIYVGSYALHELSSTQRTRFRASRIGFVFQANNLIPVLTAAENVMLPLTTSRLSARERSLRVNAILEELGLRDVACHRPGELSGGQQQRVGIARALVSAPALVLADEPTAHLDSRTGHEVMNVLRSTNRARGTTFLFSTHDAAIESVADERILLRDGVMVSGVERTGDPWRHSSLSHSATCSDTPAARPSRPAPSPLASCS